MQQIWKYPRTRHIEGSRLQPGDEDLDAVPFRALVGRHLVVEEKMDGANCAVSFGQDGELRLQSRGHYLTGGGREKHFSLFKQWASSQAAALHEKLGNRYVVYGEWLYAKHTVFYDRLPHYFLEFDVLDTRDNVFLGTSQREELLAGLPIISVPVLHEGPLRRLKDLAALIGPSRYITAMQCDRLRQQCERLSLDVERAQRETDRSGLMEGLYIKVEEEGRVVERYKYVRADFLTAVFAAEGHWLDRPIIPNLLHDRVRLFEA